MRLGGAEPVRRSELLGGGTSAQIAHGIMMPVARCAPAFFAVAVWPEAFGRKQVVKNRLGAVLGQEVFCYGEIN